MASQSWTKPLPTALPLTIKHLAQLWPWNNNPVLCAQPHILLRPLLVATSIAIIVTNGRHLRSASCGKLLHRTRTPCPQATRLATLRPLWRCRAAERPLPPLWWLRECPCLSLCAPHAHHTIAPRQMITQYCVSPSVFSIPRLGADSYHSPKNARSRIGARISRSASTPLARSPPQNSTP